MANTISILIQAKDEASKSFQRLNSTLDETTATARQQSTLVKRLGDNWSTFAGISVGAGLATRGLFGQMQQGVDSANKLQAALTGLNSVARAWHQDAGAAKQAAQDLAADGLMTVADAATGLKNLLASGFSLDQATTLMNRFKDSAAFGRQASLGFGEAIASATEGIKNGNSILVDNAGVTKNLSVMLTEAGFSANDLMNATSNASVRQAIYNGIVRETNAQVGDAARLTDSAAGKQAAMAAQTQVLYQQLGLALQPALLTFLQTVTPIIQNVATWISRHQTLTAQITIGTGVILTMIATLGVLATAINAAKVVVSVFGPAAVTSFGRARTALVGLRALVASPLAMPAIAVGAALASLALVMQAINSIRGAYAAVDQQMAASRAEANSSVAMIKSARARYDRGEISYAQMRKIVGIAARATGTNYAEGGMTLVGEHGPELVNLPRGSQVTQAYRTRQELSQGGSGGVTNILSGNFTFSTQESVNAFFNRLDKTQRLAKVGMA